MQTKIKNLRTGATTSRTFHAGESAEEAETQKLEAEFIYARKGAFVFSEQGNPKNRFELTEEQIGNKARWLAPGTPVTALLFEGAVLNICLPVKMQLRVAEAPPGIKGDRAQGGTKTATLETGAQIQVPLFVEQDDIVEVNTETGEYAKRVQD